MSEPYDPAHRRAAARLQHDFPGWLVMYGPGSRRFCAFPLFDAPRGTIVAAGSPSRLATLMRETELKLRPGPSPPPG